MNIDQTEWDRYKKKIDSIHNFLFEDGTDKRSVQTDMELFRMLIHRFSSFRFFLGVFVGLLTVGVPAVYGLMKLVELIKDYWKGG